MNTESNEPKTAQQINGQQVGQFDVRLTDGELMRLHNEIADLRAKLTALENTNRRIEQEMIRLGSELGMIRCALGLAGTDKPLLQAVNSLRAQLTEKQRQIDRQAAIFSAIESALGRDVLPDQAVEAIRELKARLEKAERIVAAAKNAAKYLDVLPNCPCADCTSGRELQKLLSE